MQPIRVPVLIFGGGAAGLWLLARLREQGVSALLVETQALGQGQTICAQGILHSGLKYALDGVMSDASREAREMPDRWCASMEGAASPCLSKMELLSKSFYLWGTSSLTSRLGMFAARVGLQAHVTPISAVHRPALLSHASGVLRVSEMVISPADLLRNLAEPHRAAMLKVAAHDGIRFEKIGDDVPWKVHLRGDNGQQMTLEPAHIVLTAGRGNRDLREQLGLDPQHMQTRPLHMAMVRGASLPGFHGHCVEGSKTRLSITSGRDTQDRMVWQLGGQLAEDGVGVDSSTLIARAQAEVRAMLPRLDLTGTEWATYRVDRAEGATAGGQRPNSFRLIEEGNVVTAWPTKLVLVPKVVDAILECITRTTLEESRDLTTMFADWPAPQVALPPWERATWSPLVSHLRAAAA